MRKLLTYLKAYRKESVLAPLFKMLEAFFELFVPLVMASIIDRGIARSSQSHILMMGAVLFALAFIGLVCSLTAQFFAAKAAVGFTATVKNVLFARIMHFSPNQLDGMRSDTLITRLTSDMNQVQTGVNMVLRLFLRSPFIVFGAMIMAFLVDVRAALIFVLLIPLLSVVVFGVMLLGIPRYRKVQAQVDTLTRDTRENFTGSRVIRAFRLEDSWIENFNENNRLQRKLALAAGRLSSVTNPVTYVLVNAALALLLWTGAVRVNIGTLTQGEVVALVNYMSQILVELVKLANLIITITKAIASGNRIQAILEMEPEKVGVATDSEKEEASSDNAVARADADFLAFDRVDFRYNGASADSLNDISFRVKEGDFVGIIGGTGSGKSTLVELIMGTYAPTKGSVTYRGREVTSLSEEEKDSYAAIVPQKAVLFRGTIASNLQWSKADASEEEMQKALEIACAKEFTDQKDGTATEVAQGGRNFSGGQRQRLTIARAVVKKAPILILDDSTSALDYRTDALLRANIAALNPKPTLFLVSQRTNSIQNADLILVLDDGRIVGAGKHEELLRSCTTYREIYESQYQKGGDRA